MSTVVIESLHHKKPIRYCTIMIMIYSIAFLSICRKISPYQGQHWKFKGTLWHEDLDPIFHTNYILLITGNRLTNCFGIICLTNCFVIICLTNCFGIISLTNCFGIICLTNCFGIISLTSCFGIISVMTGTLLSRNNF